MNVPRKRQAITVHTASFDHQGRAAFYASLPADGEPLKVCRANRAADKEHLVSILLDHVVSMADPRWQYRHVCDRSAFPMHLTHGPLGRPLLLLGEDRGPAISFSEGGGEIWAVVCGDASDIGIDVASPEEFQGGYPLHRVFHDQELHHALRLTGGDRAKASALLWSIKEAVVKALGCAFHLADPRHVHVSPPIGGDHGYTFSVCLSGKAVERYPMVAGRPLWVRSFSQNKMWLSIALVSGQFVSMR